MVDDGSGEAAGLVEVGVGCRAVAVERRVAVRDGWIGLERGNGVAVASQWICAGALEQADKMVISAHTVIIHSIGHLPVIGLFSFSFSSYAPVSISNGMLP